MSEMPYIGTMPGPCGKCGSTTWRKWGIDRQGKYARQRYCCPGGHTALAPREYPFGEQFQSNPEKLLKAVRMMKSGRMSLQKIANQCGLDRYTIYKLHNHLGRAFYCVCGRPLGHQGHCLHQWSKSVKVRRQLDWARHLRNISKPNAIAWQYAESKLQEVLNMAERMDQDGGQR